MSFADYLKFWASTVSRVYYSTLSCAKLYRTRIHAELEALSEGNVPQYNLLHAEKMFDVFT